MALDQAIDTTTSSGRLVFKILASVAEFETQLRQERQAEGIAQVKARGIRFGRRSSLEGSQIDELRRQSARGKTVRALMEEHQIEKSTVYRLLGSIPD